MDPSAFVRITLACKSNFARSCPHVLNVDTGLPAALELVNPNSWSVGINPEIADAFTCVSDRAHKLRCRGRTCLGLLGIAIFGLALVRPAAEAKRDSHASVAQFIRKVAVHQGPGDDHASYAQGSRGLGGNTTRPAILRRATLQHIHHGAKNRLESAFCAI